MINLFVNLSKNVNFKIIILGTNTFTQFNRKCKISFYGDIQVAYASIQPKNKRCQR